MKKIIMLAFALGMSGCVSQPVEAPRKITSDSGWPEVVIRSSNPDSIKERIIEDRLDKGLVLEKETESAVFFLPKNKSSISHHVLVPNHRLEYVLQPEMNNTRVTLYSYDAASNNRMAFGTARFMTIESVFAYLEELQDHLLKIKRDEESASEPASIENHL